MFSDDPDEDADNLDDETLLAAFLRPKASNRERGDDAALPDWPPVRCRNIGIDVDTATLDWFKANHADWQREIRFVLRAWVVAKSGRTATPSTAAETPSAS